MEKSARISFQGIISCILAFLGLINHGILIWMGKKTNNKRIVTIGCVSLGITIVSIIGGNVMRGTISDFLLTLTGISILVPTVMIFLYRGEFVRRGTILEFVEKNDIDVEKLSEQDVEGIQLSFCNAYEKSSRALFGDNGILLMKFIEKRKIESKRREEEERLQKEKKERERKEMEKIRLQVEAEKAKADVAKAEAMQAKAEAEKARINAEFEKQKKEERKENMKEIKDKTEKKETNLKKEMQENESKVEKEAKEYFEIGEEPAVLKCRADSGTVVTVEILEEPSVYKDLVEARLLNLEGCLKVKDVLGKKLTKSCSSLTPITRELISFESRD